MLKNPATPERNSIEGDGESGKTRPEVGASMSGTCFPRKVSNLKAWLGNGNFHL